jgi:hypothetical protein
MFQLIIYDLLICYLLLVNNWFYVDYIDCCDLYVNILDMVSLLKFNKFFIYLSKTWEKLLNSFVSIDKVKNSICGRDCGYIINHPDIFNPLNFIFLKASKVSILIFIINFIYTI